MPVPEVVLPAGINRPIAMNHVTLRWMPSCTSISGPVRSARMSDP